MSTVQERIERLASFHDKPEWIRAQVTAIAREAARQALTIDLPHDDNEDDEQRVARYVAAVMGEGK